MVVFPELTLTGYPPEDLLLRGDVLMRTEAAVLRLCTELPADLVVVVGYPKARGDSLFNTAGVITARGYRRVRQTVSAKLSGLR